MRDSKSVAAMLAEVESEPNRYEPMEGEEIPPFDDELQEEADEGQMVAVEEIMQAFEDRNPEALLSALRSFIRMAN